ncbi:hypothetical protein WOLCODRAFT_158825 [Wolfiporia cocos MD-104 SS10]|uniref:Uncharacterized protein n=1 Tax=Wolfiporia cocos (strain MD-104) TaxID=742152 RepID=A0A2H3JBI8_WOLCO|nr:hypothetical protein WOLCODRAFT_158825 [Wolfiporia cocos MD-104 SS10]
MDEAGSTKEESDDEEGNGSKSRGCSKGRGHKGSEGHTSRGSRGSRDGRDGRGREGSEGRGSRGTGAGRRTASSHASSTSRMPSTGPRSQSVDPRPSKLRKTDSKPSSARPSRTSKSPAVSGSRNPRRSPSEDGNDSDTPPLPQGKPTKPRATPSENPSISVLSCISCLQTHKTCTIDVSRRARCEHCTMINSKCNLVPKGLNEREQFVPLRGNVARGIAAKFQEWFKDPERRPERFNRLKVIYFDGTRFIFDRTTLRSKAEQSRFPQRARPNWDEEDDHDGDDEQGGQLDDEEDASMWEQEDEQDEQDSGNEGHDEDMPIADEPKQG